MKRFYIFFFLILGLVQESFTQSEFLLRDQSGYAGGLGLSTNREGNGFHFYVGYSYRGYIDANLTYMKTNGGRVQSGILSPSVNFYPIKQEDAENAPTIGISLGYRRYTSLTTTNVEEQDSVGLGWHWHEINQNQTINAMVIGVTAQHRTRYWNVFYFQPLLGAGLLMKNAGWEFMLRGGVSICTRVVHGPLLIFTPTIELQSGLTTFEISIGTVF